MKDYLSIATLLTTFSLICPTAQAQFGCQVTSAVPLELDTPTPLAFSARQVLARLAGSHPVSIRWADGSGEPGRIDIDYTDGTIRYVEQVFDDAGTGQEIAPPCYDQIEITINMRLTLQHSGRSAAFDTTLSAPALLEMRQYREFSGDAPRPDALLEPTARQRLAQRRADLIIEHEFTDRQLHGEMYLMVPQAASSPAADAQSQVLKQSLADWHGELSVKNTP